MTTFKICGRGAERVEKTRRVLGRACFLSGLDVVDFIVRTYEPNGYNIAYVKADKELVSKTMDDCDYIIILDEKTSPKALDGAKNGTVIFANAKEKITSKNFKTKCYILEQKENVEMALLGALTKDFPKVSIKSMKSAIEDELGDEKPLQAAFEEGYKNAK